MLRYRKGLTLIEVLIIIVMIGILLTLLITKLSNGKAKAALPGLETDLHNVVAAQSRYFGLHNAYGTLEQLDSAGLAKPLAGHSVAVTVTPGGYTATTSDPSIPLACTITVTGSEAGAASAPVTCR